MNSKQDRNHHEVIVEEEITASSACHFPVTRVQRPENGFAQSRHICLLKAYHHTKFPEQSISSIRINSNLLLCHFETSLAFLV